MKFQERATRIAYLLTFLQIHRHSFLYHFGINKCKLWLILSIVLTPRSLSLSFAESRPAVSQLPSDTIFL